MAAKPAVGICGVEEVKLAPGQITHGRFNWLHSVGLHCRGDCEKPSQEGRLR